MGKVALKWKQQSEELQNKQEQECKRFFFVVEMARNLGAKLAAILSLIFSFCSAVMVCQYSMNLVEVSRTVM